MTRDFHRLNNRNAKPLIFILDGDNQNYSFSMKYKKYIYIYIHVCGLAHLLHLGASTCNAGRNMQQGNMMHRPPSFLSPRVNEFIYYTWIKKNSLDKCLLSYYMHTAFLFSPRLTSLTNSHLPIKHIISFVLNVKNTSSKIYLSY